MVEGCFKIARELVGHLLRLAAYLAVIVICACIAASRGQRRRAAIAALLGYLALVHTVLLIAQKDAWPFSHYQALHGRGNLDATLWRVDFVGIDRSGREWVLDPWTFDPMYQIPLQMWVLGYMKRLPRPEQQVVLDYMLSIAERSRTHQIAGGRIGPERWLGPLALPNRYRLVRQPAVSPQSYVALRLYLVEWTARKPDGSRKLFAEHTAQ